jgi:hypothetical protein
MRITSALLATLLGGCLPTVPEPEVTAPDTGVDEPVEPANRAPIADAGRDQRVPVGTPLELSGQASQDPDGDPLVLTWEVLDAPALSRAEPRPRPGELAAFDPDLPGLFEIQLTVDDGRGGTDTDTVVVESIDTWREFDERPAPGLVYLLGAVDGRCRRGLTAMLDGDRAKVGFDCKVEPESAFVQIDGSIWWADATLPRRHACDGPCTITRAADFPDGNVSANDTRLPVPCDEPLQVLLGPGQTLARCPGEPLAWRDPSGDVIFRSTTWEPFALGAGGLGLARRVDDETIGVIDFATSRVAVTSPRLDWQFLRAWRSYEDGFRIAELDLRDDTVLHEVDRGGLVEPVGTYAPFPDGTTVLVGSRLDSAGNLYLPVRLNGRHQVLRADLDGDIDRIHDDATRPLVQVEGGGELVTGL